MLGFDLETTGTDPQEALPVSFAMVGFEQGRAVKSRVGLVNPGKPIPPEATGVHGITDRMAAERGGDLERSVMGIWGYLMDVEKMGAPVVGMNLRYDLTIVDTLLRRFTKHGLRELGWQGLCVDALVLDRHLDRYRRGRRKLAALCHEYQIAYEDAHNARADVVAAVDVVRAIAARHAEVRESSLQQLHLLQVLAYDEWAVEFSKYRVEHGEAPLDDAEYGWPLPGERPGEGGTT